MACDFTIASDLANFGQAGPKHGSAPDGGATDFLPVFVGVERAMAGLTLCEPFSAYEAVRLGVILDAVPCLKVDGKFVPNPMVVTDRWIDERGRIVYGSFRSGADRDAAKATLATGTVDLAPLDAAVDGLVAKLLMTFPTCLQKTIESTRRHKLLHWDRNREHNRDWLALNMMTEAHAGFRAFNEGPRDRREIDFVDLRRRLARGETWGPELIEALQPRATAKAER